MRKIEGNITPEILDFIGGMPRPYKPRDQSNTPITRINNPTKPTYPINPIRSIIRF